jgi:hypothetical protein
VFDMTAMVVLNLIVSIIAITGLVALMRSAHGVAAERLPDDPPERPREPIEELKRAA